MNWVSVKDRLPDKDWPVFAMCNINGKQVAIRACWIPHKFKEDQNDYDGDCVYDEAQDKYFWPEGWYEWNLCEETHFLVHDQVTHWLEITGPEMCVWERFREFYFSPHNRRYHLSKESIEERPYCPHCGKRIKVKE